MNGNSKNKVLVINPGGTSTKVGVYENDTEIFSEDLRHSGDDIDQFSSVLEQHPWRLKAVRELLESRGIKETEFDAVVGRGGPVAPVKSGTYAVDDEMLSAIKDGRVMVEHPSLLGAPMAKEIADFANCPAFIVDPVSVDEFVEESRITGLPGIPRRSLSHALSVKSAARETAKEMGRPLTDLNMIVLHLGSGITVAAQKKGRQIDSTDASASGPMAPTRSGSLPALDLAKLCFSGKHTLSDIKKMIIGNGGWKAHLGTDDIRDIYKQIDDGDNYARRIVDATQLQIAKETAAMAASLGGVVDAIAITGGIARSHRFIEELKGRIKWLCSTITVLPGENEMLALARGAVRAINDRCEIISMGPYINKMSKEQV